jgi:hypothetical protein
MKRLEAIPLWFFALLTIAAFNGAALAGLVCTRQLGHWLGLYALVENDTLGWIFSAILVIYAIAIGLIAVATWSNASAAIGGLMGGGVKGPRYNYTFTFLKMPPSSFHL